ncbi:GTP-dependent dephospho-CoA kinase family protein [Natronococcus wangiae]|uniref:GTP-dependent dephospho-CoA kinase family protein n=1 Tax=Natronococcus wangiae TaxID=3068275 RepID=UPI00273EEDBE|nr:GTP-dependent dephospho-CoA kinase family protein [Natronococcus sp. AD5]
MTRDDARDADSGDEQLLVLPDELRHELKEPMGLLETDAERLLEAVEGPLIAVGDVVTYHFLQAGRLPDVALVDERTERQTVDEEIRETVAKRVNVEATNPPAELTADVVRTLRDALERDEPTTILVDGEEDLVALPAIVVAPDGASVVYGQPGEGMVHVVVGDEVRAEVRALLERFEGDQERFWTLLEGANRDE